MYVDGILLSSSDSTLLNQTKDLLSRNFVMKDIGAASYVLGIETSIDRSRDLLGLSEKLYRKFLKRFIMDSCSTGDAAITKGYLLHGPLGPVS